MTRIIRSARGLMRGCLLAVLFATPSSAGFTPAVSITPNPSNVFNNGLGPFTLGYQFKALTTFTVNELGYFDDSGKTLSEGHAVGIWNSTGTLMASTTVTNGGVLQGQFRYEAITVITLIAGQTYTIGGFTGSLDPYTFNPTGATFDPSIKFLSSEFDHSSSLALPTTPDSNTTVGFFAGTFGILIPVAEPSSLILLGLGAMGALGLRGWRYQLGSSRRMTFPTFSGR